MCGAIPFPAPSSLGRWGGGGGGGGGAYQLTGHMTKTLEHGWSLLSYLQLSNLINCIIYGVSSGVGIWVFFHMEGKTRFITVKQAFPEDETFTATLKVLFLACFMRGVFKYCSIHVVSLFDDFCPKMSVHM